MDVRAGRLKAGRSTRLRRRGRATSFNSRDSGLKAGGPADAAWRSELSAEVSPARGHRCEFSETRSQRRRCIFSDFGNRLTASGGETAEPFICHFCPGSFRHPLLSGSTKCHKFAWQLALVIAREHPHFACSM